MSGIKSGDKIELTALQLVCLLRDTIEAAFEQAQTENVLPMAIACKITKEIFRRKREKGGEA